MRCLYCDRPLALLKRLTGDGEFCSKEHRKIYQTERNQLALARLLEAQPGFKTKRPNIPKIDKPARATPPPVSQRKEHQPERAGFISDFLREASAASGPKGSLGGPRFQSGTTVLGHPEGAKRLPGPRTAGFLFES